MIFFFFHLLPTNIAVILSSAFEERTVDLNSSSPFSKYLSSNEVLITLLETLSYSPSLHNKNISFCFTINLVVSI